jgi:3-hydroxyacyl-[acyl-carrier-protein] dehydratase
MRLLFIDRVTRLERGRRITGVKSFAASEQFLENHFTRRALVPSVILIEAMAQLLGWLAAYSRDFQSMAILALISDVNVPATLKPGARLEIDARLLTSTERDSLGTVTGAIDGETVARVDRMIFRHVPFPAGEMAREFLSYYAGVDDPSSLETQ